MRYTVGKTGSGNLALRVRRVVQEIERGIEAEQRVSLAEAKRAAVGFSSARAYRMKDSRQRRAALYGRRRPAPPLPPFFVNIQSGEFVRSWKTRTQRSRTRISSTLFNTAPHSAFLTAQGTRRMIGRPILEAVKRSIGPNRKARVRQISRKALGKR